MCRLGCITLMLHLICCYTYYCNPVIYKLNMGSPKNSIYWPNESDQPAEKGLIKVQMYPAPWEMLCTSQSAFVSGHTEALWVPAHPLSYSIFAFPKRWWNEGAGGLQARQREGNGKMFFSWVRKRRKTTCLSSSRWGKTCVCCTKIQICPMTNGRGRS